jgi:hypothetical protein
MGEEEMPLSGIRLVRQHFIDQLPAGYSLKDGLMNYRATSDGKGQWQVLTFRVIDPGGTEHTVEIEAPLREDINELAIKAAKQFMKEVPQSEPSHGDDKADG